MQWTGMLCGQNTHHCILIGLKYLPSQRQVYYLSSHYYYIIDLIFNKDFLLALIWYNWHDLWERNILNYILYWVEDKMFSSFTHLRFCSRTCLYTSHRALYCNQWYLIWSRHSTWRHNIFSLSFLTSIISIESLVVLTSPMCSHLPPTLSLSHTHTISISLCLSLPFCHNLHFTCTHRLSSCFQLCIWHTLQDWIRWRGNSSSRNG